MHNIIAFILPSYIDYKIVERLYLKYYIFYLGINNADCFLVHGFSYSLDRRVIIINNFLILFYLIF